MDGIPFTSLQQLPPLAYAMLDTGLLAPGQEGLRISNQLTKSLTLAWLAARREALPFKEWLWCHLSIWRKSLSQRQSLARRMVHEAREQEELSSLRPRILPVLGAWR